MRKALISEISDLRKFKLLAWALIMAVVSTTTPGFAATILGSTPPMGWNSWNNFACNVSEPLLDSMANHMVSSGMKAAGYDYINVDDCWEGTRDASGFIHTDNSFTGNSMQTVAAYIHSKGLKFGIYTDVGNETCQLRPGSLGYEGKDIQQYESWGVDYVKVDWCQTTAAQQANPAAAYKVMGDSVKKYATPNPIYFSICNWGDGSPWTWGKTDGGQQWRCTPDINASWGSYTGILDQLAPLSQYAAPGGWNDPDMLEVGRGMSNDEDKAHFGLWCLLSAPLITGNDLRSMSTTTNGILTNAEVIALDQDSLGIEAQRVVQNGNLEVWAKPLVGNARAVGLFNRGSAAANITVNWSDLNKWSNYPWSASNAVTVHDLWAHTDVATNQMTSYSVSVPSHGLALFKLSAPPTPILAVDSKQPFEIGSHLIRINFPGLHTLRILDLNGRELWRATGNGASQYSLDRWNTGGVHILELNTPNANTVTKF